MQISSKINKFMLYDHFTKQSKDNKEKEPRFKSWLLKRHKHKKIYNFYVYVFRYLQIQFTYRHLFSLQIIFKHSMCRKFTYLNTF